MNAIDELYWQAGMFEGEGSIRINKPNKTNMAWLLVDLANTIELIPIIYQRMWGGTITYRGPNENRQQHWRWRASAKDAQAFLFAMWPCFCTDKYRRKCVLALDFQAQKTRGCVRPLPNGYLDCQWRFYERMKELNHRGLKPLPPHERNRPGEFRR